MPNRHARLRASQSALLLSPVHTCCPQPLPLQRMPSSLFPLPAPCTLQSFNQQQVLVAVSSKCIQNLTTPVTSALPSPLTWHYSCWSWTGPPASTLFPCSLVSIYQPEGSMWNMSLLCWKSPRGLPLTRSRSKSLQWPLGPTWSNLCPNLLPPTCPFPHSAWATWPLCLPSHTRHIFSSGPLYTLYFSWSILISDILTFSKSFPDIPYKTTNLCPLMPPYSSSCLIFFLSIYHNQIHIFYYLSCLLFILFIRM